LSVLAGPSRPLTRIASWQKLVPTASETQYCLSRRIYYLEILGLIFLRAWVIARAWGRNRL
jgi:hypothetical protein